jgi:hypothetical protein
MILRTKWRTIRPDCSYVSNRLRFGIKEDLDSWDDASGAPGGALGLGAVYFGQTVSTSPAELSEVKANQTLPRCHNPDKLSVCLLLRSLYEAGCRSLFRQGPGVSNSTRYYKAPCGIPVAPHFGTRAQEHEVRKDQWPTS